MSQLSKQFLCRDFIVPSFVHNLHVMHSSVQTLYWQTPGSHFYFNDDNPTAHIVSVLYTVFQNHYLQCMMEMFVICALGRHNILFSNGVYIKQENRIFVNVLYICIFVMIKNKKLHHTACKQKRALWVADVRSVLFLSLSVFHLPLIALALLPWFFKAIMLIIAFNMCTLQCVKSMWIFVMSDIQYTVKLSKTGGNWKWLPD